MIFGPYLWLLCVIAFNIMLAKLNSGRNAESTPLISPSVSIESTAVAAVE